MLDILFTSPILFATVAGALLICLAFHEFAHALVAYKLGDDTPLYQGRVTLNPLVHLDLVGTILLLVAGFGWGKPVIINPYNFKHPKRDSALVAIAGPVSNLLLAALFTVLMNFIGSGTLAFSFLQYSVFYNLILAFFNLIPIYPLDGYKVVSGILPNKYMPQWGEFARYGFVILIILLLTNTISTIINPLINISLFLLSFLSF